MEKILIKKELWVDVKKKLLKKTFNKICKFQKNSRDQQTRRHVIRRPTTQQHLRPITLLMQTTNYKLKTD